MSWRILQGDVLDRLRELPAESVQCCVTSPPYWGLRDYGVPGQIGMEATPDEHVAKLVEVFREVRRVLRNDGVLWLNYGSFYADARLASRHGGERDKSRREPRDSLSGDPACPRSDGGREVDESRRSSRTSQPQHESAQQCESEDQHMGASVVVPGAPPTSPFDAPESTMRQSSPQLQAECSRSVSTASVQSSPQTSLLDALESACRDARRGKSGTSSLLSLLVDHIEDREPSLLAWAYSTIAFRKFKSKDLVNMPAILAEALRLDGWYVRSDCIWHKPNPMVESVRDRPTKAHEYVFLLSKSARYFYDIDAAKEIAVNPVRWATDANDYFKSSVGDASESPRRDGSIRKVQLETGVRNLRTVWTVTTEPYPEAHFATFPEALAERCIKAGTSAHGACSKCMAPWERVVERVRTLDGRPMDQPQKRGEHNRWSEDQNGPRPGNGRYGTRTTEIGWQPTCDCGADVTPCVVLDPFAGSGTTLAVAERLGRDSIGIELNPAYIAMAERRIRSVDPTQPIPLKNGSVQGSLFQA